jgi:hypothetical protein
MDQSDIEALFFRRFSDFQGKEQTIQMGRRNGQRVPLLAPSVTEVEEQGRDETETLELQDELCYDLNPVERRTWLKIIFGQSLLDIAKDEGVKRPAIYSRIRGSKKSRGMIHKNFYVARWWELRQKGLLER